MPGGAGGHRPRVRMVTIQSSTKPSQFQLLLRHKPMEINKDDL